MTTKAQEQVSCQIEFLFFFNNLSNFLRWRCKKIRRQRQDALFPARQRGGHHRPIGKGTADEIAEEGID